MVNLNNLRLEVGNEVPTSLSEIISISAQCSCLSESLFYMFLTPGPNMTALDLCLIKKCRAPKQ